MVASLLCTSAWGGGTVYVAQSGNDQNNGASPAMAVKSVARGLALATGGTEVQIAAGLYDEQLPPIPQNVTLSGGWDPSFDPNKRALLTAESLRTLKGGSAKCGVQQGAGLTCLTNSNGDRVVTLRSPGGQALQQLVVLGPDLSSKNDGSSSFGVVVDGASGARLDYVSIEAGNGAAGMTGESKLPPTGTCVRGGVGGGGGYNTGQGTIWSSNCSAQPASAGDSVIVNGVTVAQGGAGGPTGHTECTAPTPHYSNLGNGDRGGDGQQGIQGSAGRAAPTDPGSFIYSQSGSDLIWLASSNPGGRGSDGSHGAGGGGGAAGDNGDVSFWCLVFQPIRGGAGHNGGAGGCFGGGGGGGGSGGGAFALVVADTQIASAGLVLFGGPGGSGGGGGSGSGGTSGVHDDTWGSGGESTGTPCGAQGGGPIIAGTGGQGGYGGNGGGGGGGAGGNGGPSIKLVTLADGALTMDANATLRYAGGRSGTGGTGGTGGQDNNAGPPGNSGSSADQMSIPLVVHVSATASSNAQAAALAVDGNPNTEWNSGGYPPAWIELDLKRTLTLAKVRLLVGQSPAGPTTHQLYFGLSPAPTALIATLSQSTSDMQWIEADVADPQPTGRYLRVLTTASPSWVAWREIVVVPQSAVQQVASGRQD
jgi:hypothetical protein